MRAYFLFQFFFSLLLWAPIFYEFQVRMGLTDAQIFGIQSIYYLAFCLMELPTGYLADTLGYTRCLRWGAAVLVLANLLPVAVPTYAGFLWHWLGVALARSLVSGAASAWLYEYLKQFGQPHDFKLIEGRARALGLVGKVVGWAGVGYLMAWHLTLPYTLTAVMAAISWGYASVLPTVAPSPSPREASPSSPSPAREASPPSPAPAREASPSSPSPARRASPPSPAPARGASPPSPAPSRPIYLVVASLLFSNPFLMLVVLQGVASFVLERIVQVNLFQPILAVRGLDAGACGLVMAVSTLFEAAGSAWPQVLRRRMSDLSAVFVLTAVLAGSTVGIALSGALGAVVWLCVFALATGLVIPIQRQVLNDAIPDPRFRASVMSAESLVDRASCAAVAPLLGTAVAGGATARFLLASSAVTMATVMILVVAAGVLHHRRGLRNA